MLIARRTAAKIRVDRDRLAAAQALVAAGCDVVVCDDGLQHYRLARDIEIEVQDARRRYGNGRLLPSGPLREPLERAADCAFRVLNLGVASGGDAQREAGLPAFGCHGALGEWPMRLRVEVAQPLRGGRPQPLSAFAGQRVHAVAGIGDPERFFSMLRDVGIAVVPHAFPDHHAYTPADFEFGSKLHPQYMKEFDNGVSVAWHRVPWNLGCSGAWTDAMRAEHYKNLCAIDGRIVLAGEHASYIPAWMEGAMLSALDAIQRLHAKAQAA